MERAGFWRRAAALLLDILAVQVIGTVSGTAWMWPIVSLLGTGRRDFQLMAMVWWIVFPPAYFLYFWVPMTYTRRLPGAGTGQTIGHRALGLRVVTVSGSPLGLGRAFIRYVGYWIGALALGLSFLWVAFDRGKQGWHDKLAGTCVVRRPELGAGP